ncbi:M20/M25/M40 family metallo-hydrolase [Actinomyces oricola]
MTTAPAASAPTAPTAVDEVISITRDLIRIDTSNRGPGAVTSEREAAEYVVGSLQEVGLEPDLIEAAPGRSSVIVRIPGTDPDAGALVVHGHLDVVPAAAEDWSVDPFEAVLEDGVIWGRGAVDMKGMDAVILSVVRRRQRERRAPARDIVLAFFADEEAGGTRGARWIVDHQAERFAGATHAISEVGGFSVTVAGRRAYLVQTAEKGQAWLNLVARGTAGHGSAINTDNAVAHLTGALTRIAAEPWPLRLTPTVTRLLAGIADLTGLPFDGEDPAQVDALLDALGPARRFAGSSIRTLANPTRLSAGYKTNVVPGLATGGLDLRPLPGDQEAALARVAELAGDAVDIEVEGQAPGIEAPATGAFYDTLAAAILAHDPGAVILPYMLSAGTDNKSLADLGIAGYGFAPLRLPADLDFTALFHGVDERVPVDSLRFATSVLDDLLDQSAPPRP